MYMLKRKSSKEPNGGKDTEKVDSLERVRDEKGINDC